MRKVRVYDDNGDFVIEVPDEAELTMCYFNPTREDEGAYGGGKSYRGDHRKTRLSVKMGKAQIAVFLGVKGFRDESIKLTRLKQRVVIEQKLSDNGEGLVTYGGSETRELIAAPEEGTYQ